MTIRTVRRPEYSWTTTSSLASSNGKRVPGGRGNEIFVEDGAYEPYGRSLIGGNRNLPTVDLNETAFLELSELGQFWAEVFWGDVDFAGDGVQVDAQAAHQSFDDPSTYSILPG